jgi:hypothetical protein
MGKIFLVLGPPPSRSTQFQVPPSAIKNLKDFSEGFKSKIPLSSIK